MFFRLLWMSGMFYKKTLLQLSVNDIFNNISLKYKYLGINMRSLWDLRKDNDYIFKKHLRENSNI